MSEAKRMDQNIGDILISRNIITTDYFYDVIADYFNVQRANLIGRKINEEVLNLLAENLAKQKMVIVFDKETDGSLSVAMEDPSDLGTVEFLRNNLKANIKPYLATQNDLNKGFAMYSRRFAENFKKIVEENIQESLRQKNRFG